MGEQKKKHIFVTLSPFRKAPNTGEIPKKETSKTLVSREIRNKAKKSRKKGDKKFGVRGGKVLNLQPLSEGSESDIEKNEDKVVRDE